MNSVPRGRHIPVWRWFHSRIPQSERRRASAWTLLQFRLQHLQQEWRSGCGPGNVCRKMHLFKILLDWPHSITSITVFLTDCQNVEVLTMSSFPCFWKRLDMATVVSTVAAKARYVLMAALCCPSPWSVMAELKLGQNIHRKRVPTRRAGCTLSIQQIHTTSTISIVKVSMELNYAHRSWQRHRSDRRSRADGRSGPGSAYRASRRWKGRSKLRMCGSPWSLRHLWPSGMQMLVVI